MSYILLRFGFEIESSFVLAVNARTTLAPVLMPILRLGLSTLFIVYRHIIYPEQIFNSSELRENLKTFSCFMVCFGAGELVHEKYNK